MAFSLKKALTRGPLGVLGPIGLITAPFKATKKLLKGDIKGSLKAGKPFSARKARKFSFKQ